MSGKIVRLGKAILAVERIDDKPTAITVPEGAVIQISGDPVANDSRMEYVLWRQRRLAVFGVDIEERGEPVPFRQSRAS